MIPRKSVYTLLPVAEIHLNGAEFPSINMEKVRS
jgi:hypothetical protein